VLVASPDALRAVALLGDSHDAKVRNIAIAISQHLLKTPHRAVCETHGLAVSQTAIHTSDFKRLQKLAALSPSM
jgi:hypothetical protein